ncbi:MAG: hypothetical protein Q8O92_11225 [Candidatus Latescibacter sp.]|nr:hypothetical protein [Candidatus Latescibacter sp.]
MEEAVELDKYLPLSFKTRSEQDYIAFLWDAFFPVYPFILTIRGSDISYIPQLNSPPRFIIIPYHR